MLLDTGWIPFLSIFTDGFQGQNNLKSACYGITIYFVTNADTVNVIKSIDFHREGYSIQFNKYYTIKSKNMGG